MKYVLLVSHGTFAPGLQSVLEMLAGKDRRDIRSIGLTDGMGTDVFSENFTKLVADIKIEDEIILLGDIIGGSPLTTAINVITEKGFLPGTMVFGGANLPMALNAVLMKDVLDKDSLRQAIIGEAREAIKEFVFTEEAEDEI